MSPFWWMQSTASHWTVMLEEVTSDVLMKVGGADGPTQNIDSVTG